MILHGLSVIKQQTKHGPGKDTLRFKGHSGLKERLGSFELVLHHAYNSVQQQSANMNMNMNTVCNTITMSADARENIVKRFIKLNC